jgi:hypothetical protein
MLKKEFDRKTVSRLRDLIAGKGESRTVSGIGYTKQLEEHKEGDIWEEDGRSWTIKSGIKQNITKLDSLKKLHLTPLFCPNCSKQMKHHFDNDFYKIHRKCYDCVIQFETELKRLGLWKEYEKNIHNSEIDNFIREFKTWVEEQTSTKDSYITEQGIEQKWTGGYDTKKILESLDETIKHLESLKK